MNAPELRPGLPTPPARLTGLPIDDRGFPVPWFVAWIDGKPDHRVMDGAKLRLAVHSGRCWMCGEPLGRWRTSAIGPMCAITRTISEPPSHLECLRYAACACPFLTRPHAHRRAAGMPEDAVDGAGVPIHRNPGVIALWTSAQPPRPYRVAPGDGLNGGVLFELGEPQAVEWWAEGRPATQWEIVESIRSGLPLLEEQVRADRDPLAAARELERRIALLTQLLDLSLAEKETP